MLERLLTLFITLLTLNHGAIATEADGAAQFKGNLSAAISEKNDQKLEALIYFGGASPQDKQRMISMLRMVLLSGKEVEEISFAPLPSDFDPVLVVRGQKIEPTAKPKGMVRLTLKGAGQGPKESSNAYAIVDGKFLLVGMKSTDLGWKGPPDKNIGFSVVGQGSAGLQIQGMWNASGVQMNKAFKESSITFWGQHFDELNVTSASDDCDVTVTITEDGKEIYSEPLKGKGVLQYKKKS
jgi:hypothetical protein